MEVLSKGMAYLIQSLGKGMGKKTTEGGREGGKMNKGKKRETGAPESTVLVPSSGWTQYRWC